MPITTPSVEVERYRGDDKHFLHVLEGLFIPAVEKAGFIPMLPIVQGSLFIHAEIMNRLVTANLVLCDISCVNPNVFFELGIRTALNKPVAIVKDHMTTHVPFDTAVIAYLEYNSSPEMWSSDQSLGKLVNHIKATNVNSGSINSLWQALASPESLYRTNTGESLRGNLEAINAELASIRKLVAQDSNANGGAGATDTRRGMAAFDELANHASWHNHFIELAAINGERIRVLTRGRHISRSLAKSLIKRASALGYLLTIEHRK